MSSYITQFFQDCDLDYAHDGTTRWAWVASRLEEVLAQPHPGPSVPPDAFIRIDPAFRPDSGYVRPHTLTVPLAFCSPHIMHTFRVPALTLELSHKMVESPPGQSNEYAVPGCTRSGRSCLTVLARVLDDVAALRA
jgi:hypothetical protein